MPRHSAISSSVHAQQTPPFASYHYVVGGIGNGRNGGEAIEKDAVKGSACWAWGRFLSVDPLTSSYPMLTPYQFASNSPIEGIDLDGLEFLRAEEALFEMRMGKVYLKLETASWSTYLMDANAKPTSGYNEDGTPFMGTTFSTQIQNTDWVPPVAPQKKLPEKLNRRMLIKTQPKGHADHIANSEEKNRKIMEKNKRPLNYSEPVGKVRPPMRGASRQAAGELIPIATATIMTKSVLKDFERAKAQFMEYAPQAIKAVETSMAEGLVIPESISQGSGMSDILQYIISGELNYNDGSSEQGQLIIHTAKNIMKENDIPTQKTKWKGSSTKQKQKGA